MLAGASVLSVPIWVIDYLTDEEEMTRKKKEQADKMLIKTLLESDSDTEKVKAAKEFLKVYLAESKYLLIPQPPLTEEEIPTELDQIFEDADYHPASAGFYWFIRRSNRTRLCWIAKNGKRHGNFGISPEASGDESASIIQASKDTTYENLPFNAAAEELGFAGKSNITPPPYKDLTPSKAD